MELCRNSIKRLALFLFSSHSSGGVEQVLQSCGITICVRYTLELVPALDACDEESKALILV